MGSHQKLALIICFFFSFLTAGYSEARSSRDFSGVFSLSLKFHELWHRCLCCLFCLFTEVKQQWAMLAMRLVTLWCTTGVSNGFAAPTSTLKLLSAFFPSVSLPSALSLTKGC